MFGQNEVHTPEYTTRKYRNSYLRRLGVYFRRVFFDKASAQTLRAVLNVFIGTVFGAGPRLDFVQQGEHGGVPHRVSNGRPVPRQDGGHADHVPARPRRQRVRDMHRQR